MITKQTDEVVSEILSALDESTMLGAAFDCLSAKAQDSFKLKLAGIVKSITPELH